MACVEANVGDLEFCGGEHSEAGFSSENYFAKINQLLTFPKTFGDATLTAPELAAGTTLWTAPVVAAMTTAEKNGTLTSSIVFKTGMKFAQFPAVPDSGTASFSLVKPGSTSNKNMYGFEIENTFLNQWTLQGVTYGIVVYQNNEGQTMVLGSIAHPARLEKLDGKIGKSSDGERMVAIEFYCPKPPRLYKGNIQLTPA